MFRSGDLCQPTLCAVAKAVVDDFGRVGRWGARLHCAITDAVTKVYVLAKAAGVRCTV
jgi:hypothetical protein